MLARQRVRSSVALLVLLLVGVAAVGALTAGSVRDMLHRDTGTSGASEAVFYWATVGNEEPGVYIA